MLRPELRLTVGSFVCITQFPLHETFGPEYIALFSSHAKATHALHVRYFVPVFRISNGPGGKCYEGNTQNDFRVNARMPT
jgi:hypothetical protein